MVFSCDSNEFLKEEPLDFFSPENSFLTKEDFESSLFGIYAYYRDNFKISSYAFDAPRVFLLGTDLAAHSHDFGDRPNFAASFVPESDFIYTSVWKPCYRIIYDANVILDRIEDNESISEEDKSIIKAEARFFRAYMYRLLGHLYGNVPIILHETLEPKRDFSSSSRMEVYKQCEEDLIYACDNLPSIDDADGFRINNLVAFHVLTEIYISLEMFDEAVSTANFVINNPAVSLMTERFGSRVNDAFNPNMPWASGGDVYWDLFRKDNQNRNNGNFESLWVIQYGYNVAGGGPQLGGGPMVGNIFNPRLWAVELDNHDGSSARIIPNPNTYYGGRPGGFHRLTEFFYNELWEKSGFDQDIRNADYNIIRDFKVNNPKSDYNGKWIIGDGVPISLSSFIDTMRNFYPLLAKTCSLGDIPTDLLVDDQTVPGSISSTTGPSQITYRDQYEIRLAETYLLRSEAYLKQGDLEKAASDINSIRKRSDATEVGASEMNLDLILDERLRELSTEEMRMVTLTRTGTLVERSQRYHPYGSTWEDHNNLWPIPFSEIEKNSLGDLDQNPGY